MADRFALTTIGTVYSPYQEKFGIPRQPGLAPSLISRVLLQDEFNNPDAIRGIEQCSHIWLLFIFSECMDKKWSPTVRPPRLGGNKRMGVFATRSPFRPNPIGMSPVKLIAIENNNGQINLLVSGADLLHGTPIVDIKPYLPYSDAIPTAECAFAIDIPLLKQEIIFTEEARHACKKIENSIKQPFKNQLEELLRCDPRPAYKKDSIEHSYGVRLHHINIRFRISSEYIFIDSIEPNS
ncbi:MAG: tRNA (N6-threonylcarbamoyladenosine(37)-N6)-methyltransferase TrmO [Neptuniibacter sp.]